MRSCYALRITRYRLRVPLTHHALGTPLPQSNEHRYVVVCAVVLGSSAVPPAPRPAPSPKSRARRSLFLRYSACPSTNSRLPPDSWIALYSWPHGLPSARAVGLSQHHIE